MTEHKGISFGDGSRRAFMFYAEEPRASLITDNLVVATEISRSAPVQGVPIYALMNRTLCLFFVKLKVLLTKFLLLFSFLRYRTFLKMFHIDLSKW